MSRGESSLPHNASSSNTRMPIWSRPQMTPAVGTSVSVSETQLLFLLAKTTLISCLAGLHTLQFVTRGPLRGSIPLNPAHLLPVLSRYCRRLAVLIPDSSETALAYASVRRLQRARVTQKRGRGATRVPVNWILERRIRTRSVSQRLTQ